MYVLRRFDQFLRAHKKAISGKNSPYLLDVSPKRPLTAMSESVFGESPAGLISMQTTARESMQQLTSLSIQTFEWRSTVTEERALHYLVKDFGIRYDLQF